MTDVLAAVCAPAPSGFALKDNSKWTAGSGTAEGKTTSEEAEKLCNATANCVAWNSEVSYIFGNASAVTYEPYLNLCVYVKEPGE